MSYCQISMLNRTSIYFLLNGEYHVYLCSDRLWFPCNFAVKNSIISHGHLILVLVKCCLCRECVYNVAKIIEDRKLMDISTPQKSDHISILRYTPHNFSNIYFQFADINTTNFTLVLIFVWFIAQWWALMIILSEGIALHCSLVSHHYLHISLTLVTASV